jgi:hypothetical protein
MWFGIYKRKLIMIVPLLLMCGYYIYNTSELVQIRLEAEMNFLIADEFSMETARHMGTGRVAYWQYVFNQYLENYTLFQKLFGSGIGYGCHNQYLEYLMRIGIIGLFAFLVVIFNFYGTPEIFMGIVLLTVNVVYGMTGHPFDYTTLLWYQMILLSTLNKNYSEERALNEEESAPLFSARNVIA